MWTTVASGKICQLVYHTTSQESLGCAGVNLIKFTNYLRDKGLFSMFKTIEPMRYSAYGLARYVHTDELYTSQLDSEVSFPSDPSTTHIYCPVGYTLGPISTTESLGKVTIYIDLSLGLILE